MTVMVGEVCIFLCAVCAILMVHSRRKKCDKAVETSVGEVTLDLTEEVEELRKYAGDLRTLVDIGYSSSTEVIE